MRAKALALLRRLTVYEFLCYQWPMKSAFSTESGHCATTIRRLPGCRLSMLAVLILGLFAQVQMVFACELMAGKAQYVCCCDQPVDGKMGCAMGGGCQDLSPAPLPASDCCEVSYQAAPHVQAVSPGSASLQVLLLDASQPPPLPVSFVVEGLFPSAHFVQSTHLSTRPAAGRDVYLKTRRLRI